MNSFTKNALAWIWTVLLGISLVSSWQYADAMNKRADMQLEIDARYLFLQEREFDIMYPKKKSGKEST
jgi:hypothetical protein